MPYKDPEYKKKWELAHREERLARQRGKHNSEAKTAYLKEWNIKNRDKARANSKKFRDENKGKRAAQRMIAYRISRGIIQRKPCEICGAPEAHTHHDDYSKPLEVRWLCQNHHNQLHAALRCGYTPEWDASKNSTKGAELADRT